jgi:hypothetical protein
MSEVGTCEVKAAPADEARAVRHSRRREALPRAGFAGGSAVFAQAEPAGEGVSNLSTEAGRCE